MQLSGRQEGMSGLHQADVCAGILLSSSPRRLLPGDRDAQHRFLLTERIPEASFRVSMGRNGFLML